MKMKKEDIALTISFLILTLNVYKIFYKDKKENTNIGFK